ncbi:hypothetical protein EC957_000287 [Mortierella hygrophila]|uniref:Uncharacterized protein n=1 Tax=Mortierella hygrophila TaxID=979708 RepID=A0A9P6F7U0_9FUNG|nr:hypothetical protein EC957_000287 [Mortierella hygrophila]
MASHSSYRHSVLDPALEGIRRYRSPSSSRAIATSVPYVPSPLSPPPPTLLSGTASSSALTSPTQADYPSRLLPPPRSSTPLPMPPKTPPPFAKSSTSSSSSMASGLVSLPITMPPTSPPPTPRPKDRKRSTSSSVMIQQGNQPFAPTPPTPTPPSRPPPHSRTTVLPAGMVQESGHYQDYREQPQQQQRETDQGFESRRTTQYYSDESSYNRQMEQEMHESQREQSERMSRLMGQRMLQGWTMLQDTCPNPSCNGVPLMRSREKREICVACGKDPRTAANGEPGQGQGHEQGQGQGHSRGQGQGPASSIAYPTSPTSIASPRTSVMMSPPLSASSPPQYKTTSSRAPRDLNGRVSSSIVLPPPQRASRHLSSDLDKLASEDEETNSHIQLIGHVNEFSSRSLPPVPPVPAIHSNHSKHSTSSRPASTYSNSSGYSPSEKERSSSSRTHNQHSSHQHYQHHIGHSSILPAPPAPTPLSPEEEAVIHATHKTISVLLVKLEMYRSAFEVSDNPKESQALANYIRGTMECLKACRQVL